MKYKILIIFMFLASVTLAAFPQPTGYVNDYANVLTNKQALEQELTLYEQNTTVQIALVTIDELPPDQTIYTYSVELFQQWGIGQKGEDNGILVLMVKNGAAGNRLKIELGYGIQGYITGAEAGRILDAALPAYSAGDYAGAAQTIIDGLKAQLQNYQPGQPPSSTPDTLAVVADFFPLIFFVAIIIISAIASRNTCPYCRKGKLVCEGDYCVCQNCKKKFKKNRRFVPIIVGGFGGGGGGGFGGFGGGGSGGGGAGR